MAIVSLSRQKVTVYDAQGKMLEAPVSTGQSGYETPAGLYSVIERKARHYSNLYENAPMPFMQRITWSGIALHAGALPGYPASHGCIRLPYGFAGHLFEMSRRGMRVVVARDDVVPVDFAHPALFRPRPPRADQPDARVETASFAPQATRRSIAAAKALAAEAAAARTRDATRAWNRAREEAGDYLEKLAVAEGTKKDAEATIKESDALLREGVSPGDRQTLNAAKARAQDRIGAAQAQIDAIYAAGKAKIDAAVAARAEVKAAREASTVAEDEAKLTAVAPVSIFVSRKTQRLYVRQSFEPLFESRVTIRNPNVPIGTMLFTAVDYAGNDADDLRWTALAMYPHDGHRPTAFPPRPGEPARTDAGAAKAVLDRIVIPNDALDRINELIAPGSSLIVSDEEMSRETSKGTDFVVVMSGEPQGGIRRRQSRPDVFTDDDGPPLKSVGFGPFSWW
jgi:lipoprotein-anchoring transpeptidase ErfK/SrfK